METRLNRRPRFIDFGEGAARILAALAAAFGLALALLVISLAHGSPREALTALAGGAFGSAYAFADTLTKTTPLLLTGLGVAVAFRARLWNIGGEGQFLVGALAASALGAYALDGMPAPLLVPLILLAGAAAGAVWAGSGRLDAGVARGPRSHQHDHAELCRRPGISPICVHGPMQERSHAQPASEALPVAGDPALALARHDAALGLCPGAWLWLIIVSLSISIALARASH